ncbi:MAG: DNA primase [Ignavibacteria bacterium]|nr:MAG: DNA primase [Ignavibacteria bacterium]
MRIPEEKVDEIRAAADIVDVVSGFVRLKKTGRNFTGLCPFHREKTPSFNVNPERGIFKCFGCGKGGNVFTFLMEMENISFVESVEMLADRYGLLITREGGQQREKPEDIDAMYEANRLAARFFFDTLQGEQGAVGRTYYEQRGWTTETQRSFGLGFAPEGWHHFLEFARAQGLSDDILERTGLIIRKEGGSTYDRFRNRVVFPIISVSRKVLGFGARTLEKDEHPKYLNSPETPIYNKSRVLFGLSQAHRAIRDLDAVILVEGYADVLSLVQAGVENVVSTSGTALTPDQVHLLSRYTRNFFFLYDADSAGLNAMLRGIDIILDEDCDSRIVQLPTGEDPDSFVRKQGVEALRARLDSAVSFVDFITDRYRSEGKLETPEGKTQVTRRIVELIARMDDPIRREYYVHHIAEKYGIYESVLYSELAKEMKAHRRPERDRQQPLRHGAETPPQEDTNGDIPKEEKEFCELLLLAPSSVQTEVLHNIRIDYFHDARMRKFLHVLFEQEEHEGTINTDALWRYVEDDVPMHKLLADMLMDPIRPVSDWSTKQNVQPTDERRVLLDAYKRVVKRSLAVRHSELQQLTRSNPTPEVLQQFRDLAVLLRIGWDDITTFEAVPDLEVEEE